MIKQLVDWRIYKFIYINLFVFICLLIFAGREARHRVWMLQSSWRPCHPASPPTTSAFGGTKASLTWHISRSNNWVSNPLTNWFIYLHLFIHIHFLIFIYLFVYAGREARRRVWTPRSSWRLCRPASPPTTSVSGGPHPILSPRVFKESAYEPTATPRSAGESGGLHHSLITWGKSPITFVYWYAWWYMTLCGYPLSIFCSRSNPPVDVMNENPLSQPTLSLSSAYTS